MKPRVIDEIAVYVPDYDLDKDHGANLATIIKGLSTVVKSLKIRAVLISLSQVGEFDMEGIQALSKVLRLLQDRLDVIAGFCDYKSSDFDKLKEFVRDNSISIFKNFDVAYLFLHTKKKKEIDSVILYDEDAFFKEVVANELKQKGYKVQSLSSAEELKQMKKKKPPNTLFIMDTYIDLVSSFIPIKVKEGMVIYELYEHLTQKINTHFNTNAHVSKAKEGYKVFIFECSNVKRMDAAAVEFFISLSLQSIKYGAKICFVALSPKIISTHVKAKMEKASILFLESTRDIYTNPSLTPLLKKTKKSGGLTKKLIANLPLLIDASVETFETLTGAKAKKDSHKLSNLQVDKGGSMMVSTIAFQGEVGGKLCLLFPKELAKEAAMMMLGGEEFEDDEILDALSEFANIIGGKAKTLLAQKDLHITIDLPKNYATHDQFLASLKDSRGVQVDMRLGEKPMILFLTA